MRRRDDGALSLQLSIKEEFKRHCAIPLTERNVARSLDCLPALSSAVAEAWTTEENPPGLSSHHALFSSSSSPLRMCLNPPNPRQATGRPCEP